jgi:L-asparaginase
VTLISSPKKWVILATGGTIAGLAARPEEPGHYKAAQVGLPELIERWGLDASACVIEQVAQVDSKDMNESIWRHLLIRCHHWRAQGDVAGVVITHGTDTLEETAFLLHWVLAPGCPVVLTGAMLPSNAPHSDGPDNLRLALDWLASGMAQGVSVAFAGQIHHPEWVSKSHADQLEAFSSGSGEAMASRSPMGWQVHDPRPLLREGWQKPNWNAVLNSKAWPRVEVFFHHAQASPWWLSGQALATMPEEAPLKGVVLAATGHGTFNRAWDTAIKGLLDRGIRVALSSRCAFATVWPHDKVPGLRHSDHLNAVKTRIALQMDCLAQEVKA